MPSDGISIEHILQDEAERLSLVSKESVEF